MAQGPLGGRPLLSVMDARLTDLWNLGQAGRGFGSEGDDDSVGSHTARADPPLPKSRDDRARERLRKQPHQKTRTSQPPVGQFDVNAMMPFMRLQMMTKELWKSQIEADSRGSGDELIGRNAKENVSSFHGVFKATKLCLDRMR